MFKDKTARENIENLNSQVADRFNYQYNRMERLDERLNLILDHLKLKYVPETEKKEPAKLVEKTNPMAKVYEDWIMPYMDNVTVTGVVGTVEEKPKRKYTKRKKTSKK